MDLFDTEPFKISRDKLIDASLFPELWIVIYINKDNHILSATWGIFEDAKKFVTSNKSIKAAKIINSKDIFY